MIKNKVLLKTNIFICLVIVLGFLVTSIVSYRSNTGIFKQDIEHITSLTSEGVYHRIDSIFTKPINVSLTMANDNLLKTFLTEEQIHADSEEFIQTMRDYLLAYQKQYEYDSVFLVSAKTNRYYHFDRGVDRILTEDNPENKWYYSFMEDSKEYSLNIDNDEAQSADNGITIFINCKIYSSEGEVMGVVGVGFAVTTLQKIFQEYEESFNLKAYLVNPDGTIEISTTDTGFIRTDLFQDSSYSEYKDSILTNKKDEQSFWYSAAGESGFLVTRYIPNLKWHLIIDYDTTDLKSQLNRQLLANVIIVLFAIGIVLLVITSIVRKYNAQIVKLTIETEKAHRSIFQTETEKLYENIYEWDITHNRVASEATESYIESLGVPKDSPYDEAIYVIARQQVKEEYQDGYINTFLPQNVQNAYDQGIKTLNYDFMITNDGGHSYYWMRITARIFYWKDDQSVRMLTYRQNIDDEKRLEIHMSEKMLRDSLSSLYNKAAAQELIRNTLYENPQKSYAFFILDIDNFKIVNDTCGHAVGDVVIADFAQKLKQYFRKDDIIGRIGGDEFVVFIPAVSKSWVEKKAANLSHVLQYEFSDGAASCHISASIGVAIAPESGIDFETLYKNADSALYQTKARGKNGYTIYEVPA